MRGIREEPLYWAGEAPFCTEKAPGENNQAPEKRKQSPDDRE